MSLTHATVQLLIALLAISTAHVAAKEGRWHCTGPGGGGWIQSVCASPHDSEELFVGCDVGGFYCSRNAGRSYQINNTGLQDYWVECIVPHPADPNTIYVGCLSGVYRSIDRGQTWSWLRKGFPPVQQYGWSAPIGALAVDPANPLILYAGIGCPRRGKWGQGVVYRTTDGGESWHQANQPGQLPADALISDLLVDPRNSQHLYLACPAGVYQSSDAGANWTCTSAGLPHRHVRRIALCRTQPQVMYLTLQSPPGQKPWQGGVYRSEDGGKTWSPRCAGLTQSVGPAKGPAPLTSNYDRLVAHPTNPDIVYVGGDAWVSATIYKSSDGGRNWATTVRTASPTNISRGWLSMWGPAVKCLTMSPLDPERLYFGTSGAVFKTDNGGDTWQQIHSQTLANGTIKGNGLEVTCLHSITAHPRVPDRLYFGYYDIGLMISRDAGATFERGVEGVTPREFRNSLFCIAFDTTDDEHCWGSFGTWGSNHGGLAESHDGGRTWVMLPTTDTGLPRTRHRQLFADRTQTGSTRLVCSADEKGVFGSQDAGKTWRSLNAGLPHGNIRGLTRHPSSPNTFLCALNTAKDGAGGVFRSDDACVTWHQASRNLEAGDMKALVLAESAPDRVYLANRTRNVGNGKTVPGGLFRSDDGGKTWRHVLDDDFVQGVAVDPRDADVVYVGLTDHPYHDQCLGEGILMTVDGGESWRSLNDPTLSCRHVNVITVDPHTPNRLFLGTGGNSAFIGHVSSSDRAPARE